MREREIGGLKGFILQKIVLGIQATYEKVHKPQQNNKHIP